MKKIKKPYTLIFLALTLFVIFSCKDYTEDYTVPPATTVADFSYTSTNGFIVPDTLKFINKTIVPPEAGKATYLWDFGDGNVSDEENPNHIYDTAGTFTVQLTVNTSISEEVSQEEAILSFLEPITGDTLLFEDFNDRKLMPEDWVLVNIDGNIPDNPGYASMADSAWVIDYSSYFDSSNFALGISFYNPEAGADDWMILPQVSLGIEPLLTWDAMSLTTSGNYPDSYQVYVSTTTQDVDGCLAQGVFYRVIDESWRPTASALPGTGVTHHEVDLSFYAGQDVYIGFRLMTPDPGGDRLGIDNILIINQ